MQTERECSSGKVLVVESDADLKPQAEWLLDQLGSLPPDTFAKALAGGRVQVGWTLFSLAQRSSRWDVQQPKFDTDPSREVESDCSTSLRVLGAQSDMARLLRVDLAPAFFADKVVYERGVFGELRIYLERQRSGQALDSGWFIGRRTGTSDDRELVGCRVHDLLHLYPAVMPVLSLPVGFLVVMEGERLEAILNADSRQVYPPPGGSSEWRSVVL